MWDFLGGLLSGGETLGDFWVVVRFYGGFWVVVRLYGGF